MHLYCTTYCTVQYSKPAIRLRAKARTATSSFIRVLLYCTRINCSTILYLLTVYSYKCILYSSYCTLVNRLLNATATATATAMFDYTSTSMTPSWFDSNAFVQLSYSYYSLSCANDPIHKYTKWAYEIERRDETRRDERSTEVLLS